MDRIKMLTDCYKAAIEERKKQIQIDNPVPGNSGTWDNPWPVYDDFYNGNHWKHIGSKATWMSKPVVEKPFQVVESLTTFITDQRASVNFVQIDSSDATVSQKIQMAWDKWQNSVGWDNRHTEAVRDSQKFGIGWFHLLADGDNLFGQTIETVNPDSIYVSPNTTFSDFMEGKGAEYLIHEYQANIAELQTKFEKTVEGKWEDFNLKWKIDTRSILDRIRTALLDTNTNDPLASCTVYEMWLKDNSEVIFEEEIDENIVTLKKKQYPNGRRIIFAGGMVLLDEANPYKHGKFPYIPTSPYPQSGKMYSRGSVELVLRSTIMADLSKQQMFDAVRKAGGGKILVDPRFGIRPEDITNSPTQILPVKDVNKAMAVVQWPSPPRFLSDMAAEYNTDSDDAAGQHEISQGIPITGNTTAQEINALADSDRTRVRASCRVLCKVNEIIAKMWLDNLTDSKNSFETFIRITDDEGYSTPVEFSQDDVTEMTADSISEALQFDVLVEDSSTMPSRAQDMYQLTMAMFDRGLIDGQAVLENVKFPNAKAIIARMTQQSAPMQEGDTGEVEQQQGGDDQAAQEQAAQEQQMAQQQQMQAEQQAQQQAAQEQMQQQQIDVPDNYGQNNGDDIIALADQLGVTPEQLMVMIQNGSI